MHNIIPRNAKLLACFNLDDRLRFIVQEINSHYLKASKWDRLVIDLAQYGLDSRINDNEGTLSESFSLLLSVIITELVFRNCFCFPPISQNSLTINKALLDV